MRVEDSRDRSVSRMKGVVEIDAGQDREHVGLQERDQQFERGQCDGERERQHAADPADGAERDAEHDDEAREHLQRDVASQHGGEQSHAVRDRPQEEREDFDEYDEGHDEDRNARRHEYLEEFQAVPVNAVEQDDEEHQQRERHGDDDVARDREGVGHVADEVRDADQHEYREYQRKEPHAVGARGVADGGGDELVAELRHRLEASRHQRAGSGAADHQDRDQRHRDQHVSRRIGEVDGVIADLADLEEVIDIELMDRVDRHPRGSWSAGSKPAFVISNVVTSASSAIALHDAGRSHQVDQPGDEAEQKEHDETERRGRQQTVDAPANRRSDDNARDQFRRKAETARHGRSLGCTVFAYTFGLVSPDFPVVANFGQPPIQTSE